MLEKEFKQMLRSKGLIRTLLFAPVIQLILMPLAANYSVKNINLAVVDNDHSTYARQLIEKITASGYFTLTGYCASHDEALDLIQRDKADIALEIPFGFEDNLVRENTQKVQMSVNAIEGVKAGLGSGYLGVILNDFNGQIRTRWIQPARVAQNATIQVAPLNWFNPYLNFKFYIVPGILVTLITGIGVMQTAFGLVHEKEIGTIEQINVTPIRKGYFILGKLLPNLVLATVVFSIGMVVAYLFYGVVPLGSLAVVYGALFIYLFALLGLGMLLSTYSDTQQQAMSLAFFFMMIFNMMSGLFTSIDSMPDWAKTIAQFFPVSHFIKVMRMVVLKGSGFSDVSDHLWAMLGIGLFFNVWAVLNYRKAS
jgi:ABC-2 type transport system permease protein